MRLPHTKRYDLKRPSAACIFLILLAFPLCVRAADQEFVGMLAIAVEDDVAQQLGISKSVHAQLLELVDERELEALELALSLRDATPAVRKAKFEPFRKQSEQLGLKLLTVQQQAALRGMRIHRSGISALLGTKVAKQLGLNAAQFGEIKTLTAAKLSESKSLSRREAENVAVKYERQLKAVLTPDQLQAFQALGNPQLTRSMDAAPQNEFVASPSPADVPAKTASIGGLRFSFRYAPWETVIEWFAAQSNLSLLMDAPPQGTFNYSDPKDYTPAQAIDLLNSVLLTKGYTLVRRGQMLMVINLEDGIPPNLITEVDVEKLDELGEYELARCLFTLRGIDANAAAEEISRLVGPQGKVNVLSAANQLQITETAGRLRTFRKILATGEKKGDDALGSATLVSLEHVRVSDVLTTWRKLMGLSEEENVTSDGLLRVAQGKSSRQLIASGEERRVQEFKDLVRLLDIPAGGGNALNSPQLEVYSITEADPESVLLVLEELFIDSDEMRLSTDPQTGSLVALATPAEHATILATITQMQADRREVEVMRLRSVDPQLAMLSIEKLFGPPEGEEEKPNPTAPRVDADPVSRSLLIRGSKVQIEDIRQLLIKMGEQDPSTQGAAGLGSGRGNLRMIPIDAGTARRAMEQLESIWPSVRRNRIRTVTPSSSIRGERPGVDVSPATAPNNESTYRQNSFESRYVVTQEQAAEAPPPGDGVDAVKRTDELVAELPDVIVTLGDQGLLIASEDTAALDEFEDLFMTLADRMFTGSRELGIFYLKHAKADVAAEMLKQFIGGGTSASSGGGTLLGSLAGAALGGSGMGSMLGLGGGSSTARISSGTTVIADPRLNAVVVQATPKELDFIEDLLKVLDKSSSPEQIETIPRPRAIPVVNTDAERIAEIVRSVYATRLAGGGGGQQGQPSPEEFIRALSGQKNPGKTIQNSIREQMQVTISVDTRRNALLVVAPDSLFKEIQALVADLDFATPELAETVRYGRASGSSPEIIRSALTTIIGEEAVQNEPNSKTKNSNTSGQPSDQPKQPGFEEIKRRVEFMKAMQNRMAKEKAAAGAIRKKAVAAGRKK